MTREELTQAAIDCLGKALSGDAIRVHVVQAATSILLTGTSGTAPMPTPQPTPHPQPTPTPTPTPILPAPFPDLPPGYNDPDHPEIGFAMFTTAMERHGLTPLGVQGHGQQIVDAMNATWPGWNVYLSPTDAPVVPGFGSLDVTIDSGKGGWQFRPDGATPYAR